MTAATKKAEAIAAALGRKFAPTHSFKAGLTYGKAGLTYVEIEVWANEPRQYVGSDLRSLAFYESITAAEAQQVVDSVKGIIKNSGSKRR
jgi:hypothetical protein